ncbi:hypothetical protein CapIbe_001902 [Capra ibex]
MALNRQRTVGPLQCRGDSGREGWLQADQSHQVQTTVSSLEGLYQSFRKTHGSDLLQNEKQLSKFQPTATTAALLYTQSTLGTRPPCSPEEER